MGLINIEKCLVTMPGVGTYSHLKTPINQSEYVLYLTNYLMSFVQSST